MYIWYFFFPVSLQGGFYACGISRDTLGVYLDLSFNHAVNESVWMVPGTVSPLED